MIIRSRSAEQAYFVYIIRAFIASSNSPPAAPDALQWKRFQQIVYQDPRCLQPLGPLIYKTSAPWELKTEIASGAKPLRDQTLENLQELPRLLLALEKSGVPAIVLKGPALAHSVYSSPELRYISDLDLLCSREHVDAACQVIEELGFCRTTTGRTESFYEHHHFHRIYKSPDNVYVEMHWDLTVPSDFVRFELAGLFSRVRAISTGKFEFSALSPADSLLHIVSQSLPHFNSVGRLLDVCLLIKAGALTDTNIAMRAYQANLATPLWIMLNLANRVMDHSEINNVIRSVSPSWLKRSCINCLPVEERIFGKTKPATGVSRLLHVLCCPSWAYAFKTVGRVILPSQEDLLVNRYSPDEISCLEKLRLTYLGTFSALKMFGYLIWRLVSQPVRRLW